MQTKILHYITLPIFFCFIFLGNALECNASIPEINFKKVMTCMETTLEKSWTNKGLKKVFGENEIFHQFQDIDLKVKDTRLAMANIGRRPRPDVLKWQLEISNKFFQIYVDRNEKTVTIRGEVEDWKEKEEVERVIKLRAPANFEIINEIDINSLG